MKSSNVSFTGIIPLNKKSLKCEAAIDKIADVCYDTGLDFDIVTIGNIKYVFTGEEVKKYLDAYQEIKANNRLEKESCLDFLDKIKKALKKIKPEEIAKREKPSSVDELMRPIPHLETITQSKSAPKTYQEAILQNYCLNLSLMANGVEIKPQTQMVKELSENIDDETRISNSIEHAIKQGWLEEYLNETCSELSVAINNDEHLNNSLSKFLHANFITPLDPELIIKSIENKRFDCAKGNFIPNKKV